MNENEHHHQGDFRFFLGFFIGGLIGAVIIFLLGTKEGKKAKSALEEKGKDILDDFHDQINELEKKGTKIKEEVAERLMDKKEDIAESATEKLDDALAHIEKIQEQSMETTALLRKKLFKNLPKKR
ncbi:MAG: hypothetical protein UX61_C0032G0006 [Parcubacteria group bacterium GW2011_GWA2_46_7]|nr:MAG: hypothetical protein UX61_C0032G0006 [Parcubacteria group bacterium GW2011_GWA2_46_7]